MRIVRIELDWNWGKSVNLNLTDGKGGVEVQYENGGNTGYICNLYLDPAERGRMVGFNLMKEAEADIARSGKCWANLEVEADKERLINWYERQGYRRIKYTGTSTVGEEEKKYVRMFKQINPDR